MVPCYPIRCVLCVSGTHAAVRNVALFNHGEGYKEVWNRNTVNKKLNDIYTILTTDSGGCLWELACVRVAVCAVHHVFFL